MKTKTVMVDVTWRVLCENGMDIIGTELEEVRIDQTEKPLGNSDYYLKICMAASKRVYAMKAQEYPGCKVFTRFTHYFVLQVSDSMSFSDLKADGYLD